MNGREFGEALLLELEKRKKRRVKAPLTWESLEEVVKDVFDPKPEEQFTSTTNPPIQVIPEEYPRLLVCYKAGLPVEWIVVNNGDEWAPYRAWHVEFPPAQAASRPITTTLVAEVEKLKVAGVRQRPREDWERRKQQAERNN